MHIPYEKFISNGNMEQIFFWNELTNVFHCEFYLDPSNLIVFVRVILHLLSVRIKSYRSLNETMQQ